MNRILALLFFISVCCFQCGVTAPIHRAHRLLKGIQSRSFSGPGTYYDVGSGSCGEFDTNNELVVAVNKAQMHNGDNPNANPLCDTMVYVTGDHGSTSAKVVDTCPSCSTGALDLSPQVFKKVCGDLSEGVCNINWSYM